MSRRSRLLVIAAQCALPLVFVLTSTSSVSAAQSVSCHAVRRGESAAELSRRLTGDSSNTYQPWFQLKDASSRFVPKSQYDRVEPGWRACIVKETTEARAPAPEPEIVVAANRVIQEPRQSPEPLPVAVDTLSLVGPDDLALLWLANVRQLIGSTGIDLSGIDLGIVALSATLIVALVGWKVADGYATRRRAVLVLMSHFAQRFVREFERPLMLQPTERPLRARLRVSPARGRLEILLAPGPGRRYPNLSDHKKNVEYDVVRIVRTLADVAFVPGPLSLRAGWVVVPFRYDARRKPKGVPCISSF